MTHNTGSIGQDQKNWRGERSQVAFPIEFIDSRHQDKLGCVRCLCEGIGFLHADTLLTPRSTGLPQSPHTTEYVVGFVHAGDYRNLV
jgi:hypothetical protein